MNIQQFPDIAAFVDLAATANVIPVCREILADTETPVSLLQKFITPTDAVFLFESVDGGERWGRYSFLGIGARRHIRVFSDRIEVTGKRGTRETIAHDGDPLAVLRRLAEAYKPTEIPALPRFWTGFVGYMNYEMVSFFEAIPHQWPADRPLAHFIVPDALIVFDNIRHTLTAVAIAYLDTEADPARAHAEACARIQSIVGRIERSLPSSPAPEAAEIALAPTIDPEVFRNHVRRTKEYIRAGDIIQSVISQSFVANAVPDLLRLYRAQRFINPSPYLFFLQFGGVSLVGSSPETMVRLENGVATLRPIAGTRPRGANEQEDRVLADELLADEKERAEHLMLVDLGRNDLGRVGQTGTVQVTDLMVVERYSHVMHLVSNITCDLKPDTDAWDLIRATFPAGTLSGAPKVRAMEIIAELEDTPRGPYGGAVGYIGFNGNMDLAITIRTACIADGRLTVRAGAGIVADSDPERERMETLNKAKAIQKALELAARNGTAGFFA